MHGTSNKDGRYLSTVEHIHQSIADILTTPLRSRVMLPEYGSNLFLMVDRPMNGALKIAIIRATIDALTMWEPRVTVGVVNSTMTPDGKLAISLSGQYTDTGQPFTDSLIL